MSLFVWMDRPLSDTERAQLSEHVVRWRPVLSRGAGGYQLEPVQLEEATAAAPTAQGNGHGGGARPVEEGGAADRAFALHLRRANVRSLIEQALALRAGGVRPTAQEIEQAQRAGTLRYAARLQPGPAFARDVLAFVEAARELAQLLPEAELRLHDGQLLRDVRPQDVELAALRRDLGG